jgi:hypothetical protein
MHRMVGVMTTCPLKRAMHVSVLLVVAAKVASAVT